MLERSSFHTNSRKETFPPLINCVIDNALLETIPNIDETLLQFIDVINWQDPLLYLSPNFCSQPSFDLCCWVANAKNMVK